MAQLNIDLIFAGDGVSDRFTQKLAEAAAQAMHRHAQGIWRHAQGPVGRRGGIVLKLPACVVTLPRVGPGGVIFS